MQSPTDADMMRTHRNRPEAVSSGSDLRALTPREILGLFVGARARHFRDAGDAERAEGDYLLARWLFPGHRATYGAAMGAAVQRGMGLFEPADEASPLSLAEWIRHQYRQRA